MINGLPGPMATAAAESCLRKGLDLCPVGLTGPTVAAETVTVRAGGREQAVSLRPAAEGALPKVARELRELGPVICVDYTHPTAVLGNTAFYVEHGLPFVMGSTGGDRKAQDELLGGGHMCVIAPNMGKQIVALQLALEKLAQDFPGCFDGYALDVTESHQASKADTSGTCLAVVDTLAKLQGPASPPFPPSAIKLVRDRESSLAFGVPESSLTSGHAHHTYRLTSPDGSTRFELQHDVDGRGIYADGTADAVRFLGRQIERGGESRTYTMIDVLEAGALE
jgi:4-hydroxy-tetrahydrodipicolinate reductase